MVKVDGDLLWADLVDDEKMVALQENKDLLGKVQNRL